MYELVKFSKEVELTNSILEISSIGLECNYLCNNNLISGNFILEGSYKNARIVDNKDEFKEVIPFEYEFNKDIEDDTAIVEIKDFTYQIDGNSIMLDIDYEVTANEKIKTFENEEEFDRFIIDNDVEVIDEPVIEEKEENVRIIPEIEEKRISSDAIMTYVNNDNDKYITYHIYVCNENDTFDSISKKYDISIEDIKNYNGIDELFYGLKIIIPSINE